MDLWVVAAATGAGYLAKYLQNSTGEKEDLSESSSQDQTSPFCILARKKGSKFSNASSLRDENLTNGNYEISDILTLTSLPENIGGKDENSDFLDNGDEILHESETNRLTRNDLLKRRKALGFSTKTPNPLESCLTKLNKEKIAKKGYIFSPPPSPSTSFAGPLIVNRIINRDARDLFGEFVTSGDGRFSLGAENELLGSRLTRRSGLIELPKTRKHKTGNGQLNIASSRRTLLSQGPPNAMVLFFAGITIGIISSVTANKRELDNLNAKLKQKESLVQDFHEEIEMRNMLSLKGISNEDNQSLHSTNRDWELIVSSSEHDLEESTKHDSKETDYLNNDKPELMSRIEAELEAELEKLDLNITSSGLERISDYVELDSDLEADVVQGDLKIHMAQPADASQSESNNDENNNNNNNLSSNYTVSPWELSLRLHEVIQSRLEARIEELEQALKTSRKRHSMEWLRIISSQRSENGEVGSLSTPESQTYAYEVDDMDPEASDTYNEAYEEVIRMIESDEETPYLSN